MTNYRRNRIPGGTYFFTLNLADRGAALLTDRIDVLRDAFAQTRAERWFKVDAMVVLPDHLHAVWTLPEDDSDFSTRLRLIKARFSRGVGLNCPKGTSQRRKGERGIWQRRFWEHTIRDATDFRHHVAYCWGNPVKHGLVKQAAAWPFSSIHRDIAAGRIDARWSEDTDAQTYGERRQMGASTHPTS